MPEAGLLSCASCGQIQINQAGTLLSASGTAERSSGMLNRLRSLQFVDNNKKSGTDFCEMALLRG